MTSPLELCSLACSLWFIIHSIWDRRLTRTHTHTHTHSLSLSLWSSLSLTLCLSLSLSVCLSLAVSPSLCLSLSHNKKAVLAGVVPALLWHLVLLILVCRIITGFAECLTEAERFWSASFSGSSSCLQHDRITVLSSMSVLCPISETGRPWNVLLRHGSVRWPHAAHPDLWSGHAQLVIKPDGGRAT